MTRILSTYLFIKRKLTPALLAKCRVHASIPSNYSARENVSITATKTPVRRAAGACATSTSPCTPITRPPSGDFNARHESAAPLLHLRSRARQRAWKPSTRSSAPGYGRADAFLQVPGAFAHGRRRATSPIRAASTPRSTPSSISIFSPSSAAVTIALENTARRAGHALQPAQIHCRYAPHRLAPVLRHRPCNLEDGVACRASEHHARVNDHRAHPQQSRREGRAPAALRERARPSIGKQALTALPKDLPLVTGAEGAPDSRRSRAACPLALEALRSRLRQAGAGARPGVIVQHRPRCEASVGQEVTAAGLALQHARVRQAPLPQFSRRHGHPAGRSLAQEAAQALAPLRGLLAGIQPHRHRNNSRRAAFARRLRDGRHEGGNRPARRRFRSLSHPTEGTRRPISFSTTAISGFARRAGIHSAHSRRSHPRRP